MKPCCLGFEEYGKFKQFTDSLITRSSKLAELINSLEGALEESGKDAESADGKRVSKPPTKLYTFKPLHVKLLISVCLHASRIFPTLTSDRFSNPAASNLRSVLALEASIEILEQQYETCDKVRVDTKALQSGKNLSEEATSEFLDWL